MSFKIIRTNDGKEFKTESYKFVVFENERGKEMIEKPKIGTSLVIPPYNGYYRWLTSPIIEVIDDYHFKTKNSEYKIDKL